MRTPLRFLGIVLLLALGGGCDTTQPLQIETETYQLDVKAISSNTVSFFNVYYMVEDGVPDQVYLFCKSNVPPVLQDPISIPWNFTITVEILRAGDTVPEVMVSSLLSENNLTPYDTKVLTGSISTQDPITITSGGQLHTFRFTVPPPRRMSAAHEEVMQATSNPLYVFNPTLYSRGNGLCSEAYPGAAGIDGLSLPLSIELNKGDTIIVQARKSDVRPAGTWFVIGEPRLKAELLLNGQRVQVQGDTLSEPDPGAGISFSFTAL